MSTRAALESALQASWSFDELVVYADYLIAEGDPRGELVTLDLQPSPADRNWWVRRRAALEAWLGDELADRVGRLVQHGFIHELRDGTHAPELLDGPLGDVIRGYTTWGQIRVHDTLEHLASRPRPWLARLAIMNWSKRRLGASAIARLVAATPNLEELVLAGHPIANSFPHPAVRRLVVESRSVVPRDRDRREVERRAVEVLGLDARVTVTRFAVPTGRAGVEYPDALIPELRRLVADVPDCGELAARHAERFPEPVAAALARLAAAGIVELDGPIARVATIDRMGNVPWYGFARPREFVVEANDVRVTIRSATDHAQLIAGRLYAAQLAATAKDALMRYLPRVGDNSLRALSPDETRGLATALGNIHELRGLSREAAGNEAVWLELEQLITVLAGAHAGATIAWT